MWNIKQKRVFANRTWAWVNEFLHGNQIFFVCSRRAEELLSLCFLTVQPLKFISILRLKVDSLYNECKTWYVTVGETKVS